MNEELLVPILTAIIGSLTSLGVVWYRNYLAKKIKENEECKVQKVIEEDRELIDSLEELRRKYSADRLTVLQFHNGGDYYTGKSIQKISMSYEVAGNGIQRIIEGCQNLPVSACNASLKPLMDNWCVKYYDVKKDFPESLCKIHQLNAGNKSTYHWGLFDLEKNAIGILTLDYVKRRKNISDEQLDNIKLNVVKLPGYL